MDLESEPPSQAIPASGNPTIKRGRGRPKKDSTDETQPAIKRGRGRPKKDSTDETQPAIKRGRGRPKKDSTDETQPAIKRGRGRPKKDSTDETQPAIKRGRGRPKKDSTDETVKRGRGRPKKDSTDETVKRGRDQSGKWSHVADFSEKKKKREKKNSIKGKKKKYPDTDECDSDSSGYSDFKPSPKKSSDLLDNEEVNVIRSRVAHSAKVVEEEEVEEEEVEEEDIEEEDIEEEEVEEEEVEEEDIEEEDIEEEEVEEEEVEQKYGVPIGIKSGTRLISNVVKKKRQRVTFYCERCFDGKCDRCMERKRNWRNCRRRQSYHENKTKQCECGNVFCLQCNFIYLPAIDDRNYNSQHLLDALKISKREQREKEKKAEKQKRREEKEIQKKRDRAAYMRKWREKKRPPKQENPLREDWIHVAQTKTFFDAKAQMENLRGADSSTFVTKKKNLFECNFRNYRRKDCKPGCVAKCKIVEQDNSFGLYVQGFIGETNNVQHPTHENRNR